MRSPFVREMLRSMELGWKNVLTMESDLATPPRVVVIQLSDGMNGPGASIATLELRGRTLEKVEQHLPLKAREIRRLLGRETWGEGHPSRGYFVTVRNEVLLLAPEAFANRWSDTMNRVLRRAIANT